MGSWCLCTKQIYQKWTKIVPLWVEWAIRDLFINHQIMDLTKNIWFPAKYGRFLQIFGIYFLVQWSQLPINLSRSVEDGGGVGGGQWGKGTPVYSLLTWTLKHCFDFSQTHINFFLMLFKRWFGLSVSKNWQRVSEVSRYNCKQCQGWNSLWSSMYLLWTICMSIICILCFGQSMFHQVRIYNQVI